jgi:hypothetical protein
MNSYSIRPSDNHECSNWDSMDRESVELNRIPSGLALTEAEPQADTKTRPVIALAELSFLQRACPMRAFTIY